MKRLSLALIVLSALAGLGWIAVQEAPYMRLARAIELFGMVVRELNEQYVQPIETEQLTYEAIEHMLSKLDPYTEFYREEQTSDLDFLLQGRYIGVGIRLGMLDSLLTVMSVTDGTSAHRAGVRQGDVVLRIDSIDAAQKEVNQVRKYLRGPLGTVVRMQLQRGDDTINVELRREEILVRNVTYAGMLPGNIALVRLERFSRRAPEEFRLALDSLRTVSELRGLVVDIRDNPGGLLDAAVSIAEMFLRPGDTIVATRTRGGADQRAYVARAMPYVDTTLPIVVVVNSRSASASEIFAGALQDHDRAVIIGDTTVGKGLVQTVVSLPYNAALKLTTARYYTPSGRSIQRVRGFCQDCWIQHALDSEQQRVYTTCRYRRPIRSGVGIVPDSVFEIAERDSLPSAISRAALWQFATRYASRMQSPPAKFDRPGLLTAFERYLDSAQWEQASLLGRLDRLREQAVAEGWGTRTLQQIERLRQSLKAERSRIISESSKVIAAAIEQEILCRFLSDRQQVAFFEPQDKLIAEAAQLIRTRKYREYLLTAHGTEH
ncbi:MAG: carboxyl-terminal processing protease [Candidatus Kapaibacterium sp.]|nr:MAG: carboxyl-terminal processing protease [Candidatus Kapabacteria bacterium]